MKLLQNPKMQHINANDYAFYVRNTTAADSTTGVLNTFENYLKGISNKKDCKIISVDPVMLKIFKQNAKETYSYLECVYSPKESIDAINSEFSAKEKKRKTKAELLQEENDQLRIEMQEKDAVRDEEMKAIKEQLKALTGTKKGNQNK